MRLMELALLQVPLQIVGPADIQGAEGVVVDDRGDFHDRKYNFWNTLAIYGPKFVKIISTLSQQFGRRLAKIPQNDHNPDEKRENLQA